MLLIHYLPPLPLQLYIILLFSSQIEYWLDNGYFTLFHSASKLFRNLPTDESMQIPRGREVNLCNLKEFKVVISIVSDSYCSGGEPNYRNCGINSIMQSLKSVKALENLEIYLEYHE